MAPKADEKSGKQKVRVILGKREGGFAGIWAAKKHWPEGETTIDLTDDEIANVASRPELVVLNASGQRLVADGPSNPAMAESMTQDEMAMLAEYRRERSKNPELGERYGKKYRVEKGKVDIESMLNTPGGATEGHPGRPSTPGGAGPLENAEILRGAPPPEGSAGAMETRPLETSTAVTSLAGDKGAKKK